MDGADVFPVAVIDVAVDAAGGNGAGNDVLAEVGLVVVQQLLESGGVKDVDAHAGEEHLGFVHGRPKRIERLSRAGLLHEFDDPLVAVHLHNAERARLGADNRLCADRDFSTRGNVLSDDILEVDAIELVAGQDSNQIWGIIQEMTQTLTDGIRRALKPAFRTRSLLRGQNPNIAV